MDKFQTELIRVGVSARLTAIREELTHLCALSPEIRELTYRTVKSVFTAANGHRTKGVTSKLETQLKEARKTRAPEAPKTDKRAVPLSETHKRKLAKKWTPTMRAEAAARMKAMWTRAKKDGRAALKPGDAKRAPRINQKAIPADSRLSPEHSA